MGLAAVISVVVMMWVLGGSPELNTFLSDAASSLEEGERELVWMDSDFVMALEDLPQDILAFRFEILRHISAKQADIRLVYDRDAEDDDVGAIDAEVYQEDGDWFVRIRSS